MQSQNKMERCSILNSTTAKVKTKCKLKPPEPNSRGGGGLVSTTDNGKAEKASLRTPLSLSPVPSVVHIQCLHRAAARADRQHFEEILGHTEQTEEEQRRVALPQSALVLMRW